MKFLANKNITKKIIIIIVIMMLFNFVTPSYSQAATFGGELFKPLGQLLCGFGDAIIKIMQYYFMGDGDIKGATVTEIENSSFHIKYSPAIIFSNKVPGLDVNFFNPQGDYQATKENYEWTNLGDFDLTADADKLKTNYGFDQNTATLSYVTTDDEWYNGTQWTNNGTVLNWQYNGKGYMLVNTVADTPTWNSLLEGVAGLVDGGIQAIIDKIQEKTGTEWSLYEENFTQTATGKTIKSSASMLRDTVATWYKALRAIALVGLLSVLVYIGIRILLSSVAQEKAKYQKMIMNWLVAVCILFILQYIMVFTLTITQKIIDVFSQNVVKAASQTEVSNGTYIKTAEDTLMGELRTSIAENSGDFSEIFGSVIMYLVLVIYTAIFTWQYLKRLIYMAFFTMIAPLVALTYPIDKLKDGQAQAFNMWTKEYVFNALIQPVHLLLYYIFVQSAMDLAKSNFIYSIVAIGFLIPAEKFFRKMFGFGKASTVGNLGAAAGGAMVMNAVNKMKQGSSGNKEAKNDNKNPVRTHNGSGGVLPTPPGGTGGGTTPTPAGGSGGTTPVPAGGSGGTTPTPMGGSGGRTPAPAGSSGGTTPTPAGGSGGITPAPAGSSGGTTPAPAGGSGGTTPTPAGGSGGTTPAPKPSISNGIKAVRGRYINRKTPKKIGRLIRKAGVGALGAAALGTVGLAAGLATGDASNVLKYGAAGVGAGLVGANKLVDKGLKSGKENKEAFKEGYYGKEEYEKNKAIDEAWENPEIYTKYPLIGGKAEFKEYAKDFVDGGITNPKEIVAAKQLQDNKGITKEDALYVAKLNKHISNDTWGDDTKRETFEKKIKKQFTQSGMTEQHAEHYIRLVGDMKKLIE